MSLDALRSELRAKRCGFTIWLPNEAKKDRLGRLLLQARAVSAGKVTSGEIMEAALSLYVDRLLGQ